MVNTAKPTKRAANDEACACTYDTINCKVKWSWGPRPDLYVCDSPVLRKRELQRKESKKGHMSSRACRMQPGEETRRMGREDVGGWRMCWGGNEDERMPH